MRQQQAAAPSRQGPPHTDETKYNSLKDAQIHGFDQNVLDEYQSLVEPHLESFNYFVGEGLERVTENIDPVEVRGVLNCSGVG